MKRYIILILLTVFCKVTIAQTLMDKYKVEDFTVSLPYYMSKTGGLSNDAAIQFRNMVKDVSGYIIAASKISTNGIAKFISTDLTYLDDETLIYYYYFVGIVETKNAFYKVICSSTLDTKPLFKSDFQKIFYSIKD